MKAQTNAPYKIATGIGYLTNDGIILATKKKKKVNDIAIKKWNSNPQAIIKFPLAAASFPNAPPAMPLNICSGVVPFLM